MAMAKPTPGNPGNGQAVERCPACNKRFLSYDKQGKLYDLCFPCSNARRESMPTCPDCGKNKYDAEKYARCYDCSTAHLADCECGNGKYDPDKYAKCYDCSQAGKVVCEFCGEGAYDPDYYDKCYNCSTYGIPDGKATPPPDSRPAAPVVDELDDLPF